jgi:hypothetical protein
VTCGRSVKFVKVYVNCLGNETINLIQARLLFDHQYKILCNNLCNSSVLRNMSVLGRYFYFFFVMYFSLSNLYTEMVGGNIKTAFMCCEWKI